MTMIVGIKCGDSAVLCADSQATYGDTKTEVDKLTIAPFPKGDVVIGTAGDETLSAGLVTTIVDALAQPFTSAHAVLQKSVVAFHKSDVYKADPRRARDKGLGGLIGLRYHDGSVLLFHYLISMVTPVTTYRLAGEDIPPYESIPRRLYRSDLAVREAAILAIDVVEAAKATSTFCGGTTRLIRLEPTGVVREDPDRIYATALHVAESNRLAGILRLQAADHTIPDRLFQENLKAFCNSMTHVRHIYGSPVPPWQTGTLGGFDPDDED